MPGRKGFRRAALIAAAFAAALSSAAVLRFLRAPVESPVSESPTLPMPARTVVNAPSETSSLGMIKRDEEPAVPAPQAPPMTLPEAPKPEPPPKPAVLDPQPTPEKWTVDKAPRLKSMLRWGHLLLLEKDEPETRSYAQAQAPQAKPQAQPAPSKAPPPKEPAPQAVSQDEAPPPPTPKRGRRPSPPPAAPVQTGPSTSVSAAPPPPVDQVETPVPYRAQTYPQPVEASWVTNGASDTPPPPNPVSPNATASACLKAGAWKNSWTGVCYDTHAACQQAQPKGQCTQPPGVAGRAKPN